MVGWVSIALYNINNIIYTSSTVQGGGGSFKNNNRIGNWLL